MKLQDLKAVQVLTRELQDADRVLLIFTAADGPVECYAQTLHARGLGEATVALPQVAREVAVEAAQRSRARIINELAALGVTVED